MATIFDIFIVSNLRQDKLQNNILGDIQPRFDYLIRFTRTHCSSELIDFRRQTDRQTDKLTDILQITILFYEESFKTKID